MKELTSWRKKGDPWPWHRSSGGCQLCRSETTGQLLHPAAGSDQMGCSCTWQRSLFRKTNTGATEEIPALNQSWRGCNHPTSHRPYKGHQVRYLVPRTTDYLSPLWSNTDHWPYAPGVCSVTECRDEYYTADSLNTLFETIPETCIVEFLREVGFFYLIWCN